MNFTEIYNLRKKIKTLSREELEDAFMKVSDEWLYTSDDLGYANSIIDGSWPEADECIAIVRAGKMAPNKMPICSEISLKD